MVSLNIYWETSKFFLRQYTATWPQAEGQMLAGDNERIEVGNTFLVATIVISGCGWLRVDGSVNENKRKWKDREKYKQILLVISFAFGKQPLGKSLKTNKQKKQN